VSRAVLSVGANLGDRLAALRSAAAALRPWLQAASPVYETPPWGPVPQADYLNAVLIADDPDADPAQWLQRAFAIEAAAGRTREVRWGARTLDVDVVAVGDIVSTDPDLTLPHPRAAERAFVLVPWLAADPHAELAGTPLAALIAALDPADVAAVRMVPGATLA